LWQLDKMESTKGYHASISKYTPQFNTFR